MGDRNVIKKTVSKNVCYFELSEELINIVC